MHKDAHWQRAMMLFRQGRYELAAAELRQVLAEEPGHAPAHALLAHALVHTDALDAALAEARQAIAHDPELGFAHSTLATVLLERHELDDATAAIRRAIELAPDDVDHRATLSQIHIKQRRWDDALAAADAGLALDPTDTDCLNLRSVALVKLGRTVDATDSVDAALARDPDNPLTHQARGFALLHRGDAKGALHHFQEALRRDPSLDGARSGLVEALKAQNPLYRTVLGWFLWLDRFSQGKQRQILIGAWLAATIASRGLRRAGYTTAGTIVSFSWLAIVMVTTLTVPLFNLLLLLHPIGRHALHRQTRNDAILLGCTVLVGLGVGAHAWLADSAWSTVGWFFWLLFPLPVAGIGTFWSGWARTSLQAFCVALAVAWIWWAIRAEQLPHADLAAHAGVLGWLLLAAAFSTWFVMLAPKGRPPRRAS